MTPIFKRFLNPIKSNTNSFDSLIGAQTKIHGDVEVNGTLRVFGQVNGQFIKSNKSGADDTLIIAQDATIDVVDVDVPHLIVEGVLHATTVHVRHSLKIAKTGRIIASNIYVNNVEIEFGGIMECDKFKNGITNLTEL